MRKIFYYSLVGTLFLGCHDKNDSFCDTCENFQIGYVIGYDPCSGVLDPDNEEVGFIVSVPLKGDTAVTYNLPKNIYDFPPEYFDYYKSYCMFPDSAWDDFQIKFKYRVANESERKYVYCTGDIYGYYFYKYVKDRQIVILSTTE